MIINCEYCAPYLVLATWFMNRNGNIVCACVCVHLYIIYNIGTIREDWCSSNWCTCDFGTWHRHWYCLSYFIHHSNSTFCLCFCKVSTHDGTSYLPFMKPMQDRLGAAPAILRRLSTHITFGCIAI